jgi:hypothetical protein
MSVRRFLFGDKDKFKQLPTQNADQRNFLSNTFQQLGMNGQVGQNYNSANQYNQQMLSGDPNAYSQWAAPYETQFQEQTLPGLAERFAGLGGGMGGGVMGSSGFGQAIGGAATQFKSNLAGLYAQLQQQAAQNAMGQYNNLASGAMNTQTFQNAYQPGSTGALGGIAQGVGQGFGQGAGLSLGNSFTGLFNSGQQQGNNNSSGGNSGYGNAYRGRIGF